MVAFHPLLAFGLGFWQRVQEGHVGLVYNNGALQSRVLVPGLHFTPSAYLGFDLKPFNVLEDVDCFGCADKISVKTNEGTEWLCAINIANQVAAENVVSVVQAQGIEYDKKIGRLVTNVLKEVFSRLTNLEVRKDKAADLNELVHAELKAQMKANWPTFHDRIAINYVTFEYLECKDKTLKHQWEVQVEEEAKRVTTEMKAKTEAADHSRIQASEAAEHKRLHAAAAAKAQRARDDAEAENERELSKVRTGAKKKEIENAANVAAAVAQAEASRVQLAVETEGAGLRYQIVEGHAVGAKHEQILQALKAIHNNEKITTVGLVVPEGGPSLIRTVLSSLGAGEW
jgi:regulator of protease activity HflC (stomatin/prohibitin superfamily)